MDGTEPIEPPAAARMRRPRILLDIKSRRGEADPSIMLTVGGTGIAHRRQGRAVQAGALALQAAVPADSVAAHGGTFWQERPGTLIGNTAGRGEVH
jgi:hypothetical protein